MKNVAAFMIFFFMGVILYAQENNDKAKFEKKGDLVEATYFHENGTISQVGFFKDNKPTGIWKVYDENGNKITQAQYDNGVKNGRWFFWKENKLTEVEYDSNHIVKVNDYQKTDSYIVNR
ncbi:toxin-antitoxin system YwqK family antitoxin [Psychroflexus salis]|nr:nicotinic acid mononucleotide adenyltransferase [Psychroflexus salis]